MTKNTGNTKNIGVIHTLETMDNDLTREAMQAKGLEILRLLSACVRKRKAWIKARENQIEQLEQLRGELFDAYDALDEDALEDINNRLIAVLNTSGKQSNGVSFD